MPQGLVQPNNAILYAGEPQVQELDVKTATEMYPGRLVQNDTNEWDIKVGADNSTVILGVLDVEPAELRSRIYDAGDQARVLRGDIVVLVLAISGASIAIGQKIQCAGSGKVDQYATVNAAIGYALQAKSPGASDEWILAKLTI